MVQMAPAFARAQLEQTRTARSRVRRSTCAPASVGRCEPRAPDYRIRRVLVLARKAASGAAPLGTTPLALTARSASAAAEKCQEREQRDRHEQPQHRRPRQRRAFTRDQGRRVRLPFSRTRRTFNLFQHMYTNPFHLTRGSKEPDCARRDGVLAQLSRFNQRNPMAPKLTTCARKADGVGSRGVEALPNSCVGYGAWRESECTAGLDPDELRARAATVAGPRCRSA